MERVDVHLPGREYPVLVGQVIDRLPGMVAARAVRAAVISDQAVEGLASRVEALLAAAGVPVARVAVPGGEDAKTMASLTALLEFLERAGIGRDGCVVAVGGGSIGDVAGFAAAVWQRGVPHFQVPTTLLAMVDSSVGGKTGVNTRLAKNAVGAFWQPAAVLADLGALASLPDGEYRAAFGEVVKYAVAMDADLAATLERSAPALLGREPEALERAVARCVALKAGVVAEDETDVSGRRAVLNYGHTAGHALETALEYRIRHGEAVAHGMRVAARVGERTGSCDPSLPAAQDRLLAAFGLPGPLPPVNRDAVLAALPRDKKSAGGRPRWVLPVALGSARTGCEVPDDVVREAVMDVLP